MIPLNAVITISKTQPDRWGIGVASEAENHKVFLNYKLVKQGTDASANVTTEIKPEGSFIMHGYSDIKPSDSVSWIMEGESFKVKPDDVSYIKDSSGKIMFTKVSF